MNKPILAYKFAISEPRYPALISNLNELFVILQQESQAIIQNPLIQLESFSEIEYENKFKGHFYKKLSQLTHKNYLNFDYPQKSRVFKLIAEALRKNFKSLLYKRKIATILASYDWDIETEENKEKIRTELSDLNLFPSFMEIKNLCRAKTIPQKENFSFVNLDGNREQGLLIPIDYTACDPQIITQQDGLLPHYDIVFKGGMYHFEAILPYFVQKKLAQGEIDKFCKPKFQLIEGKWCCVIAYVLKQKKVHHHAKKSVKVLGIDLGKVKNYSGSVVEIIEDQSLLKKEGLYASTIKNKNKNQDILSSKESYHLLGKIKKIKGNLEAVYRKIGLYDQLIDGIKNNQKSILFEGKFIRIKEECVVLESKRKRLLKEKQLLSKKISQIKKHKAYCVARDIVRQIGIYQVDVIALEKLNWVENKGGKWDFSQQQDIIERKVLEKTTRQVIKVNPAYSSCSNPYLEDYLMNKKIEKGIEKGRMIKFKHLEIDRDFLASINLGNRGLEKNKEQGKTEIYDGVKQKVNMKNRGFILNVFNR